MFCNLRHWRICAVFLLASAVQAATSPFTPSMADHATGYMEWLLKQVKHLPFTIITPADPKRRGCQLSMLFGDRGRACEYYSPPLNDRAICCGN